MCPGREITAVLDVNHDLTLHVQGQALLKDACPLSSTAQSTSGLAAPGEPAKLAASGRGSFQLPFAGSSLTPLGPPCRADQDCSQHSGHGCTPVLCRYELYRMLAANARSSAWMPSTCRLLRIVPRHMERDQRCCCWRLEQGRISVSTREGASRSGATRLHREGGYFLMRPDVLLQDGT